MLLPILLLFFTHGVLGHQRNYRDGEYIIGSDYRAEESESIFRPCELNNLKCMRRFLRDNSRCVPPGNPKRIAVPDPIFLPIEKFFFPVSSMTITHLNATIRGFRESEIKDFFLNQATGNLVIAVNIPTYNFSSHGFFTYQRVCKEPIALPDYNTFEVDNLVITAAIPKAPHFRLELADIHAFTHNTTPRSYIGPNAYTCNDPDVRAHFDEFNANIVTVIKEVYTFHAYLLMTTFIQETLCDFGLNSYKSYDGYGFGKWCV